MTPELLFSLCNLLVLPGWVLLLIAPRWKYAAGLISGVVVPTLLAIIYLVLVLIHLGKTEGGFGSLAEVQQLFQNPYVLVAGWVHYLVFDLFIASWQVRNAQFLGINHGFVIPCLVFTFFLGPVGLLAYLILRLAITRTPILDFSREKG